MNGEKRSFGWKVGGVLIKRPLLLLRGRVSEKRLPELAAEAGALASAFFHWRGGVLSCALPPCGAPILAERMPVAEEIPCGALTLFGLGLEDPDLSGRIFSLLAEAETPFYGIARSEIGWTVLLPEERLAACAGLFSSLIARR